MTGPVTAIAVGVPARDEAAMIAACVSAIDVAAAAVAVPVRLVVVADGCTDDTATRAAVALRRAATVTGRVVAAGPLGVGRARALALDTALADLGGSVDGPWLATTDADTAVGPDWLRGQLRWADAGYDAVTGLVEVAWEGDGGDLATRYRASLADRGLGVGHRHVHGANLGLRAAWWAAVGGCGAGACGEDHELWERLGRAGARRIGVDDVAVTTSGRLTGRVEGGFAAYLSALVPVVVAGP